MKINLDNKTAVVLHRYNYRNSSLIANFFICDSGKVSAIAKGVKGVKGNKSKKNQFSLLQPFQKLTISLTGKNELLILTNIEAATAAAWTLSGKSLYCAYYLNELLLRLLPSYTDCSEIFALYDKILTILSTSSNQQSTIQYEVPLRMFELKLLEYLGYGLNLSHDIETNSAIENDRKYYYIIGSGPVEYPKNGVESLAISGKTLNDLAKGQLSDEKTLQQSKQLLKWTLAGHLGDKPLKSRELFKQLYGVN